MEAVTKSENQFLMNRTLKICCTLFVLTFVAPALYGQQPVTNLSLLRDAVALHWSASRRSRVGGFGSTWSAKHIYFGSSAAVFGKLLMRAKPGPQFSTVNLSLRLAHSRSQLQIRKSSTSAAVKLTCVRIFHSATACTNQPDAGKNWSYLGLHDTRQIGRILIDPKDPDIVLLAALGHGFGPNTERGVFRSTDGGKSWTRVLYKDENTGAIDLAYDP